jgi:hypothetical protein
MKYLKASKLLLVLSLVSFGAIAEAGQDRRQRPDRPAADAKPAADKAVTLADARGAFVRADSDKSGALDASEAAKAGIDASRFSGLDSDGAGGLSRDEFIVGFHQEAVRDGKSAATDLAAESTRLQALRRARRSQRLERRAQGPGAARQSAQPQPQPESHEQKLQAIRDSLSKRVRNGGLTEEQALAAYESVAKRLDNALLGEAAQPNELGSEQHLATILETLNTRVRNGSLSQREATAVYERVSKRVNNALGTPPAEAGSEPMGSPVVDPEPAQGGDVARPPVVPSGPSTPDRAERASPPAPNRSAGGQPARVQPARDQPAPAAGRSRQPGDARGPGAVRRARGSKPTDAPKPPARRARSGKKPAPAEGSKGGARRPRAGSNGEG